MSDEEETGGLPNFIWDLQNRKQIRMGNGTPV